MRVDAFLSRKARAVWPASWVVVGADGRWVLRRADETTTELCPAFDSRPGCGTQSESSGFHEARRRLYELIADLRRGT